MTLKKFNPIILGFVNLYRDNIIIKIDKNNQSVGNICSMRYVPQTPYLTLLRPPYWILWGQYWSNLNFDLRNGIPDPKNGIYHVSHKDIAWKVPKPKFHPFAGGRDLWRTPKLPKRPWKNSTPWFLVRWTPEGAKSTIKSNSAQKSHETTYLHILIHSNHFYKSFW